jgi:preprotein translocase subunit SecA
MLQVLDTLWKEHLATMDYLRQGIHLRGYAQKNPKQEYKREAFEMFESLLSNLKYEVIKFLSPRADPAARRGRADRAAASRGRGAREACVSSTPRRRRMAAEAAAAETPEAAPPAAETAAQPFTREQPKVGRNEPCPCGSGKKYKHCHGWSCVPVAGVRLAAVEAGIRYADRLRPGGHRLR